MDKIKCIVEFGACGYNKNKIKQAKIKKIYK